MQEVTTTQSFFPSCEPKDVLTEILREGAQSLLVQAIEAEVADWIERHAQLKDDRGRRLVVRNGRICRNVKSPRAWARSKSNNPASLIAEGRKRPRSSPRRSCRRTCGRPRASRS